MPGSGRGAAAAGAHSRSAGTKCLFEALPKFSLSLLFLLKQRLVCDLSSATGRFNPALRKPRACRRFRKSVAPRVPSRLGSAQLMGASRARSNRVYPKQPPSANAWTGAAWGRGGQCLGIGRRVGTGREMPVEARPSCGCARRLGRPIRRQGLPWGPERGGVFRSESGCEPVLLRPGRQGRAAIGTAVGHAQPPAKGVHIESQ